MYTKTERKQLEAALKRVQKCSGDCKHCEKCHIYTASTPRALYMAVGCDALPEKYFFLYRRHAQPTTRRRP